MTQRGVTFDVIGLSYYPQWQGSFSDLQGNVNDLATRYDKDVIVVETAYPWTTAVRFPRQCVVVAGGVPAALAHRGRHAGITVPALPAPCAGSRTPT
ncbi:hypothetical protein QF002_006758 [Paraburkholderia youngii]